MNAYFGPMLHGIMVYRNEEKDEARYYANLLIGDKHLTRDIINGR